MTLDEVLKGVGLRGGFPATLAGCAVAGLDYDSRRVRPGHLFFAFAGQRADGRRFAADALAKGALAVVSELPQPEGFEGAWIAVEHGRRAMSIAARNFYCAAAGAAHLTGITGTNGKTTTSYITDSILCAAGWQTALHCT